MLGAPAYRTLRWLLLALPLATSCTDDDGEGDVPPIPTSVIVDPEAFRGDLPCGEAEGALRTYQATLLDVTEGYEDAFQLPSSALTECTRAVTFEFVEPGRRYVAVVHGYDRTDLETQRAGVPVVVDGTGSSVAPQWGTTCWGYDDVDYAPIVDGSMGGAGPINDGFGGFGAAYGELDLGVSAFEDTAVTVRGCDPLGGVTDPDSTGVSIDIRPALVGLACGRRAGQVDRFAVTGLVPPPEPGGTGGTGGGGSNPSGGGAPQSGGVPNAQAGQAGAGGALAGAGGMPPGGASSGGSSSIPPQMPEFTTCGDVAVIRSLPPGVQLRFTVEAYSASTDEASWETTCRVRTVAGVVVPASCDPLQPVN